MSGTWVPDSHLDGFWALTLPLAADDGPRLAWHRHVTLPADHLEPAGSEPLVATLVSRHPGPGKPASAGPARGRGPATRAVLYVHGFVDYFFQAHMADFLEERSIDVFALDLRRCGRSLRPWHLPNDIADLAQYDEEIDLAVAQLREHYPTVILLGHSTGGLIAPLWAARHPGLVSALVLNSPWLDLNENWLAKGPATWCMRLLGRIAPTLRVSSLAPYYGRSIHVASGGEWSFDLELKPHEGFDVRAGWLRAVRAGHRSVRRGLGLTCPVLVCHAAASGPNRRDHAAIGKTDSVLDIADMIRLAPRLGTNVAVKCLEHGIHDLALSSTLVREEYLSAVADFCRTVAPVTL